MLKTCFGCCPLHHGVSAIAIINIVWNITEALKHIYHRNEQYERFKWVINSNGNTSVSPDDNSTAEDESADYWSDVERIPVMSGIYMDYVFMITISWVVLEFISNCCLKQSTFKRAPQKVYLWLVVYYANLLFMVLHLVHYTILMMRHSILVYTLFTMVQQHFGHFFVFLTTLIIMSDFLHRLSNYYQYYQHTSNENSTSQTFGPEDALDDYFDEQINITLHYNSTNKYSYQNLKISPLLSEIFMDYLFIVKLAWGVMEFYLNISLKQSTYTVSPEKIYAWLVIYYSNLCSGVIFLIIIILNVTITEDIEYFGCFLEIIITAVEIYIVQSYYRQQKLAAVSDFVHLKWKYIPKPKTRSGENRSTINIIPENPLADQTDDQSGYIPIFVRDLRRANS